MLVGYLFFAFYLIFIFEESLAKKLFIIISKIALCGLVEIMLVFTSPFFFGVQASELVTFLSDTTSPLALVVSIAAVSMLGIFYLIFLLVWRKFAIFNPVNFYSILLLGFFSANQIFMTAMVIEVEGYNMPALNPFSVSGGIIGLLASAALTFTLFENVRKKQAETQLRELEQRRREEEVHYLAIEEKRSELSKIRHDFNNYISAAQALIDNRDFKSARELLEQLKNRVAENNQAGGDL